MVNTANRQVLIRTVGQEPPQEKQLNLAPGTLVSDALEQSGFLGFRLLKAEGGHFQPGENLYEQVADGQKVLAAKVDDLSAG